MDEQPFKPYVSDDTTMKEFTFKAVFLGVIMAIVLGAANAYLGMKVGLTVAATFPAAVVAMAALRPFKGTILEENIARTTASVGEALVAGAIFTIPAFVLSGVWEELHIFETIAIMMIGGVLGVLLIIILRRTLVEDKTLPFPESVAASEIIKAGQRGETGAKYVLGGMGFAAVWEIFKNAYGVRLIAEKLTGFVKFSDSKIEMFGRDFVYGGGIWLETPNASPMLMGVGYIVGFRVASVLFAGAAMGWWVLVPLAIFLNPDASVIAAEIGWANVVHDTWYFQIRPLAVGTMIVAAFYTLYRLRESLFGGVIRAFRDLSELREGRGTISRSQIDIDFKNVIIAIGVLSIPMFFLYDYFSDSIGGSLMLTAVMLVLGFLFAAVAGYLVGMIGSSNNPISGLTLSTLLIAAVLMVMLGVTGDKGVMAVLGIAGVICCAAGVAGDMMQDLKVGYILGGTPKRMQAAEIIGVICASAVLVFALKALDKVYEIGSTTLPAPQAGLMALMAKGIVGGEMAWPLVITGMLLGVALIIMNAPSPMLIAVGMYLPLTATAPVFVGGIIRLIMDKTLERRKASVDQIQRAENTGILMSSGFIAGESLMAVIMAFVVLGRLMAAGPDAEPTPLYVIAENPYIGMLIFLVVGYLLIQLPIKNAMKK
ncbi:MAG: oligopeptide transporter, OPT family [Candidatus Latescibacterota bacterium]|jgi:putative OPT family oligopeptide transporter